MNIKKYYIKSHRCLWLCLLALSSNSVMAVACKAPMPVHKFWRVGMLSHISPSIIQNVNNGLVERSLCQKNTYVVPQEGPYVNKYTTYNTMEWHGRWWHHSQQQYRYAFNIQLTIGIGATVGLYCSMGHCEAAPHNNAPVLPVIILPAMELYYLYLYMERLANKEVNKIIQKWVTKLSPVEKLHMGIKHWWGGSENVDLGVFLRHAAREGNYSACLWLVTYSNQTGHKLSIDFHTIYNTYTPLDYAAAGGHYYVVQLLLNNGARSMSRKVRTYIRKNDSSIDNLLKTNNV